MLSIALKEIAGRPLHFILCTLAIITATAFFVLFCLTEKASQRETARILLKMGYNLRILPAQTSINAYYLTELTPHTIPENYLYTLSQRQSLTYNHLLGVLQQSITWRDSTILLTGITPEICPPNRKKPSMFYQIEPGTAYLGHTLAQKHNLKKGDKVNIAGKEITIAHCLAESGTRDDIRIQCHISDAQKILGSPDRLSEIRAVDCMHCAQIDNALTFIRSEISDTLPDTQVLQMTKLAQTRHQQRQMIQRMFFYLFPAVIIICGVWLFILFLSNVRERRSEIGILRALGFGTESITFLFLSRAVLAGICGASAGSLIGYALAWTVGPGVFKVTAMKTIYPDPAIFLTVFIGAIGFATLASFIPLMIAVSQDPARTLSEE